jgi:hypothetical protein
LNFSETHRFPDMQEESATSNLTAIVDVSIDKTSILLAANDREDSLKPVNSPQSSPDVHSSYIPIAEPDVGITDISKPVETDETSKSTDLTTGKSNENSGIEAAN